MRQCETASHWLKVLAHPQRLMILCLLSQGEKSVHEIEESCGASQSAVSQFLKAMRLENLITSRREGRYVYYRINDERVLGLVKALHGVFCG